MAPKPTYEELEQRVNELEKKASKFKRLEVELRESEARYRAVVDDQTELICRYTRGGILTFVNQAYCRYFAKKPEELIGSSFIELIPEVDREKVKKYLNSVGEAKLIAEIEHQVVNARGEIRWQKWTDRAIFDAGGRLLEYQSVGHDITDRVQAAAALKESEKRYELAARAGLVGVWDWNINPNENFIDPNLKLMLGYEDHEIRNHMDDWAKLVHPDDAEKVLAEANAHLKGLTPNFEIVHRMLHKDGTVRWFLARGNAMRDNKGKPCRMVGTHTNITALKRLEDELIKAHDKLEKRVEARTAELVTINRKLKQEIKERRQAEKALRERETELENKKINLEEVNTALKVLLKGRDEDKIELEEKLLLNVKSLIMPYFEKLKNTKLNDRQEVYTSIIESNLKEIISPFVRGLSAKYLKFTSGEIQIANFIKQDRTTKEIAKLLSLSPRTIESYRDNIRKKLGIKNKKVNLRSYLLSINNTGFFTEVS